MSKTPLKYRGAPLSVALRETTVVELPARAFRARLAGMLFETDKTFLLPASMTGVRGLRRYYDQHPGLSVLVTGHTDTVGDTSYNEGLSGERAAAMAAFLIDDVDGWLQHYAGTPHSRVWGTREDQLMLSALPSEGEPHYSGPPTGVVDARTDTAVREFQASAGLAVDGVAGPNTRRALVTDYMALDETSLPEEATLEVHGCGEHHLQVATPDDTDEAANRRVEMFLFEGPVEPPPRAPCGGCPQYAQWVARTVETVDLTLGAGWLDLSVFDDKGKPLDAEVRISGPVTAQAQTMGLGTVRFAEVPAGSYEVAVTAEGFVAAGFAVAVVPGDPPPTPVVTTAPEAEEADPSSSLVDAEDDGAVAEGSGGGSGGSSGGQTSMNTGAATLSSSHTQLILIEHPDQPTAKGPALAAEAREGVLRKGGVAGGTTTPLPDVPPWNDVWIVLEGSNGRRLFPVDSDTGGNPLDGETVIRGAAGQSVTVQTTGVHHAPVHWHVTAGAPLGSVDGVQEARLTGRARLSLWADPSHVTVSNLGRAGDFARDIVDDLSLLVTAQCNDSGPLMPVWDVGREPKSKGFSLEQVVGFYRNVIDVAHGQRVPILAGFGLVDRGKSRILRFDKWLDELTGHGDGGQAEAARFASELVRFIDGHLPGFDGISFDIESCGIFPGSALGPVHSAPSAHAGKIEKLRAALRFFYHAVADLLAPTNRICAITVGGMMSDDFAVLPLPSVPNVRPNAMLAAKLHTYDLAIGKPNVILRPMAYDNAGGVGSSAKIRAFNSDPGQFEWHQAIVDFALKTKRVHPHQFQLGIKDFAPKTNGVPSGQGGTVAQPGRIRARCEKILRPQRVGLCMFALFKPPSSTSLGERWKNNASYNKALNADPGGVPLPRPVIGQPLQVPLDAARLAELSGGDV